MRVLLYSEKEDDKTELLTKQTEGLISEESFETCKTIKDFRHILTLLGRSPDIAVIMVRKKEELGMILSLKDLLADVLIIVVLPDREKDTISQAHKLCPRFLTYMDGNFEEVASVLKKMIERLIQKASSWSTDPLME